MDFQTQFEENWATLAIQGLHFWVFQLHGLVIWENKQQIANSHLCELWSLCSAMIPCLDSSTHRAQGENVWALSTFGRDLQRSSEKSKASEAGRRASLTVSALVEKRLQFRSNLSLELIMCQKNQFKKRDSAQCHFWPYLEVFITLDLRPKKCVKNNQNRDLAVHCSGILDISKLLIWKSSTKCIKYHFDSGLRNQECLVWPAASKDSVVNRSLENGLFRIWFRPLEASPSPFLARGRANHQAMAQWYFWAASRSRRNLSEVFDDLEVIQLFHGCFAPAFKLCDSLNSFHNSDTVLHLCPGHIKNLELMTIPFLVLKLVRETY